MKDWKAKITKVYQEAPGIARVAILFTKDDQTFEREMKLTSDNFQTRKDIDREINHQLEVINNFTITIDLLKAELDKNN